MKKIFLLAMSVALVMAFAVPAMAKVTIGGIVFTDAYWQTRNADYMQMVAGNASDSTQSRFHLEVPGITRLYGKWVSKEGNVGMHIEFGIEGENSVAGVAENVWTRYAYGWWQINDIFKLIAGQADETFAILKPGQLMGLRGGSAHIIGYRFGNFGNDREPRVQINAKLTDNFSLDFSAVYPALQGTQTFTNALAAAGTWRADEEEGCMPKFEIMMTAKFGPVTLFPAFMYYKTKYGRDAGSGGAVLAQTDDEIVAYGWAIPIQFGYGPFSLAAEYVMGENLAAAGGGGISDLAYRWSSINSNAAIIHNTEVNAFWIDLGYTVSPLASIHFIWGMQDEEQDLPNIALDRKREKDMWGLTLPLNVAPHFKITPNYFVYDYGDLEDGNINQGGRGKETLYGVQFQVTF